MSPYHDHDMVIAEGSVRAGKTIAMIDSFMTWSLYNFRDKDFILAGKSFGALERNVLRPMFQILASKGISYDYRRGDNRSVRVGSNIYHCFGANTERSQDFIQGLTAAGAFGDEAALMPQSFVEQMKARCSVDGAKIWLNCNPQGPFHPLKVEYIDRAEQQRCLVLHFTMSDISLCRMPSGSAMSACSRVSSISDSSSGGGCSPRVSYTTCGPTIFSSVMTLSRKG